MAVSASAPGMPVDAQNTSGGECCPGKAADSHALKSPRYPVRPTRSSSPRNANRGGACRETQHAEHTELLIDLRRRATPCRGSSAYDLEVWNGAAGKGPRLEWSARAEPSRGGCSPDLIYILSGRGAAATRGVAPRTRVRLPTPQPIQSSGDGHGIHQPRSIPGRARDRAICPAVTRSSSRGGRKRVSSQSAPHAIALTVRAGYARHELSTAKSRRGKGSGCRQRCKARAESDRASHSAPPPRETYPVMSGDTLPIRASLTEPKASSAIPTLARSISIRDSQTGNSHDRQTRRERECSTATAGPGTHSSAACSGHDHHDHGSGKAGGITGTESRLVLPRPIGGGSVYTAPLDGGAAA